MEKITYKSIDDLKTEIQKRAINADLNFTMVMWMINGAGIFGFAFNIFVLAVLIVITIFTEAYNYYREAIIMAYGIFIALSVLEINIMRFIRKRLLSNFIDIKYDIAWQCFTEYEDYENINGTERTKFFEDVVIGSAGLIKEK